MSVWSRSEYDVWLLSNKFYFKNYFPVNYITLHYSIESFPLEATLCSIQAFQHLPKSFCKSAWSISAAVCLWMCAHDWKWVLWANCPICRREEAVKHRACLRVFCFSATNS